MQWIAQSCLLVAMVIVAIWVKEDPDELWIDMFAFAFPAAILVTVAVNLIVRVARR